MDVKTFSINSAETPKQKKLNRFLQKKKKTLENTITDGIFI